MQNPLDWPPATLPADLAATRGLDTAVYAELMTLARGHLRIGSTISLDAPSLVHEAWIRFSRQPSYAAIERKAFFAYASRVMRTVVIDYLRERGADKRGNDVTKVTLTTGLPELALDGDEVQSLHLALLEFERIDARAHAVVEMRYFGGMSEEEIAAALGVSTPTVKRDWRRARTWLFAAIGGPPP